MTVVAVLTMLLMLAGGACGGQSTPIGTPDANEDGGGDADVDGDADTDADSDADSDGDADSDADSTTCPERVSEVVCDAEPPECDEGFFPAVEEGCWTGQCLDCIDGCQTDEDCVAVMVCGCSYHEGCSWGETVYRLDLETNECIVPRGEACIDDCPILPCPEPCGSELTERCCDWCDVDYAVCDGGACRGITDHMCM